MGHGWTTKMSQSVIYTRRLV